MHTQVAIIGAGPAGLTLAALLHRQGISSIVLERHDRTYIETRTRAGILKQPTVDLMHEIGVGDGITREGMVHNGFYVRFDRTTHHLDFTRLVGGHATVYPQQKLVADLVADRVGGGEPLLFEASVRSIDTTTDGARLQVQTPEGLLEITADFVAGCDGFHG